MKLSPRDISLYAALIAVALALSMLEAQLPIPLPGVKLGLANAVTLFALYSLGASPAAVILFCRCILASAFGGGITSLVFSLFGGAAAFAVMLLVKRIKVFSIYGVSIAGAAAHGAGQIFAACIMLGTLSAIYYLPFLLISAVFTGAITAFISQILISRLKKMYKS